uniref:Uncharacterized protein n=1 Tax=Rhizophora mucronata TaxID=61149 RepID=A0A2P2P9Q7_RHIMU
MINPQKPSQHSFSLFPPAIGNRKCRSESGEERQVTSSGCRSACRWRPR